MVKEACTMTPNIRISPMHVPGGVVWTTWEVQKLEFQNFVLRGSMKLCINLHQQKLPAIRHQTIPKQPARKPDLLLSMKQSYLYTHSCGASSHELCGTSYKVSIKWNMPIIPPTLNILGNECAIFFRFLPPSPPHTISAKHSMSASESYTTDTHRHTCVHWNVCVCVCV